jgi:protein SCO1/2
MARVSAVLAAAAVAGLLGGSIGWVLWTRGADPYADCRDGVAGGSIGGPFTLVSETGATVTDREVITGPTLMYFGYTFCPDVCPFDNQRNAEAVDILEEMGIEVTPVMVSVDPARDTPDVMAAFTDAFHPRMLGLTGSAEQVEAAKAAYRAYAKIRDPGEEFYLVDHSTFTYLMTPDRGFVDFFKREVTPQEMARRTACYLAPS